jgi:protein-S-isoprenylcysteine O-methyltransferase Ste14
MRTRGIIGVVLCLVGIVWIGQGANLIGGSFMSGQELWLGIGCVCLVLGLALLAWAWRTRRTSAGSG